MQLLLNFSQRLRRELMKSKPLKLAVIANCQARPMAQIIRLLAPQVDILEITITHLARQEEKEKYYEIYKNADYIFAQRVSDHYPTEFLRSDRLKQVFPHKVITWPNIFFRGQCADLCYMSRPGIGKVVGPLGEYQNLVIYEAWQKNSTVSDTMKLLTGGGQWLARLETEADSSFTELQTRELQCDVTISSEIAEHWRNKRLFFTFNHPSKWLLEIVARRLLQCIACKIQDSPAIDAYAEPLDRIIPALLPVVADHLGLQLPTGTLFKGCEIQLEDQVKIGKRVVYYELYDLIETSFRVLDRQLTRNTSIRVS
jgi:hypothetical protein